MQKRILVIGALLLIAAAAAGTAMWWFSSAAKVERLIAKMADPSPTVGFQAWTDLRLMLRTDGGAFKPTARHVLDTEPISFHVGRYAQSQPGNVRFPFLPTPDRMGMKGKAWCKTVGEAILALAYNEGQWRTDLRDQDWNAWWEANKRFYIMEVPDSLP